MILYQKVSDVLLIQWRRLTMTDHWKGWCHFIGNDTLDIEEEPEDDG